MKQSIPRKYMPVLKELFGIDTGCFDKELTDIERLEIQKEKSKRELKPVVIQYEQQYSLGEINDLVEVPVYDKEEVKEIERIIYKTKLILRFKDSMNVVDKNPYMETYKLLVELMEKAQHEEVLQKTIQALAHYYEVLRSLVSSGPEQDEYEGELFELFDDHNY